LRNNDFGTDWSRRAQVQVLNVLRWRGQCCAILPFSLLLFRK